MDYEFYNEPNILDMKHFLLSRDYSSFINYVNCRDTDECFAVFLKTVESIGDITSANANHLFLLNFLYLFFDHSIEDKIYLPFDGPEYINVILKTNVLNLGLEHPLNNQSLTDYLKAEFVKSEQSENDNSIIIVNSHQKLYPLIIDRINLKIDNTIVAAKNIIRGSLGKDIFFE